ncbi:MAG: hypothetical protein J6A67_05820 [Clostridia bacterium]|nr:hypothetical protein [Clostridia bacterium]
MANKKAKPAAGKSVAGTTNSGKNNPDKAKKQIEKQKAEAAKQAQRVQEERLKAERERAKKSEDIRKRREKQKALAEKNEKKILDKEKRQSQWKNVLSLLKKIWEKVSYYTSKEFLSSFNYTRIILFVILPIVILVFVISFLVQATVFNVPTEIRNYEFNGRVESHVVAKESTFNSQQQSVFIETLDAHGSRKFDFYINSSIPVGDNGEISELCFGNPNEEDYVLVATVFDSDGEVLYRSLGIESEREINEVKLFKEVAYGTHKVKVAVNAYDSETNEKIGTKYARIKLSVGVDEDVR